MITNKKLLTLIKNTFKIDFASLTQVNNSRMTWVTVREGDTIIKYFSAGGKQHFTHSLLKKNSYIIVKYNRKNPSNNTVNIRIPLSTQEAGKVYPFKTMPMYEEMNIQRFSLINTYINFLDFAFKENHTFFTNTVDDFYCIDFSIENIEKIFITNRYGVLNIKEYISTQMKSPYLEDDYLKEGFTLLYVSQPVTFVVDIDNRCLYSHFINEMLYMLNLKMDFDFKISNVDDIERVVGVLEMIEI